MSLQAVGEVVECASVAHVAGYETARQIGYLVGEGVPYAMEFLRRCVRRGLYGVALLDERVEVNHFEVVVEELDDDFAGDPLRKRSYGSEDCSFGHGGRLRSNVCGFSFFFSLSFYFDLFIDKKVYFPELRVRPGMKYTSRGSPTEKFNKELTNPRDVDQVRMRKREGGEKK